MAKRNPKTGRERAFIKYYAKVGNKKIKPTKIMVPLEPERDEFADIVAMMQEVTESGEVILNCKIKNYRQ